MRRIIVISAMLLAVAGCSSDETTESKPAALVGTHYGLTVARDLPDGALARVDALTNESLFVLPDGASREWSNPETGASGTVSILSSSKVDSGRRCRLFAQKFYYQGKLEKALGEACLDEKKRWILQPKSPG